MPSRKSLQRAGALLLTSSGALLATAGAASAATYTVTTTTDGGTGSLRAAVVAADAAGGASTITLPAGTYKLTIPSTDSTASSPGDDPSTGDLDIDAGASITIAGAGTGQTVIDATREDRVFAVHQGASLSISGLTIQHAESDGNTTDANSWSPGNGGAIYNDGALKISDSALLDATANLSGGAVFSDSDATSTVVSDSTLSHDSAVQNGAAIFVYGGTLSLSGDTFTADAAQFSGSVYDLLGSTVAVTGTTFSNDSGGYGGGGMFLQQTGAITIADSTFSTDSSTDDQGGALRLESTGTVAITGSQFTDDAGYFGGAIYADASGLLSVSGSSFSGGSAEGAGGGAIATHNTDIAVTGSAFTDNSASSGGALFLEGMATSASGAPPTETITNSSFTGNSAFYGGAVHVVSGYMSVTASTFAQNGGYNGGALLYDSGDGLALVDDTLSQNTSAGAGAGVYLNGSSAFDPIVFQHDTIAGNTDGDGGAVYNPNNANTIENSIIADNSAQSRETGADCQPGADYSETGNYTDAGHNLDSDGSCFGGDAANGAVGDLTSTEPQLSALADNGGPVWTMALEPGSPAIGAASGCIGTDARGATLPSSCDMGAFQTAAVDLAVTGSGPASVSTGQPLTYVFTVTNHGPGPDGDVTLTDTLPATAEYFGASSSQGSCTGSAKVVCDLGALEPGASATVRITVIATANGTLTDSASVSGALRDANTADKSATVITSSSTPVATVVKQVAATLPSMFGTRGRNTTKHATTLWSFADAGNSSTTYWFRYGTTRRLANTTRTHTLAASTAVKHVQVRLTHLRPHTTYYFRLFLSNSLGQRTGRIWKFKTR